jgi:hypothetical protein
MAVGTLPFRDASGAERAGSGVRRFTPARARADPSHWLGSQAISSCQRRRSGRGNSRGEASAPVPSGLANEAGCSICRSISPTQATPKAELPSACRSPRAGPFGLRAHVDPTEAGNAPALPVTVDDEPEMASIATRLHDEPCGVIVRSIAFFDKVLLRTQSQRRWHRSLRRTEITAWFWIGRIRLAKALPRGG